jgi:hypothetical protein
VVDLQLLLIYFHLITLLLRLPRLARHHTHASGTRPHFMTPYRRRYDPHHYMPASGTRLSSASLSQLAQYEIGNSVFFIITHSVISVSMCFIAPFHDCSPLLCFIPCDFLPYAPVGSRILGPCVTMLISLLHMYSRSPCALPQVVLICFTLWTQYTVSYITCTVIYLVPQSEYQLCSPPTWFTPFDFVPFPSASPLIPWLASVLPCASLAK